MQKLVCQLYLERTEPDRNLARFYRVSLERDLFGQPCLYRQWGRIGHFGRQKIEPFCNEHEALKELLRLVTVKRHRGYRPARLLPRVAMLGVNRPGP